MSKHPSLFGRSLGCAAGALLLIAAMVNAAAPPLLNHQGRIAVGGVPFAGNGEFKFALVDAGATTSYWSNDGTSVAGSEPAAAVTLPVVQGLYAVLLGDTTLANMTALPATVFDNAEVYLRVWFNDGVNGSELITPDHRLASAPWALRAGKADLATTVPDGSITSAKIAAGAVGSTELAPGLISSPESIAGTTQVAVANATYLATNGAATTLELPASADVGDVVTITGVGAGGWTVLGYDPAAFAWIPRESDRFWKAVASSADGTKLVAVIADFSGGGFGQIYTSTDIGVTWTPRESDRFWVDVASSADGTKLVAVDGAGAGSGGKIYSSTDSGVTWVPRENDRFWSAVASSADGTKLVAAEQGGMIYTSTDSGVNWTARESARDWSSLASSADGTTLVAVAQGEQIYTSTDSGVTWTARENARGWTSVASSADGSKLVAAEQFGKLYTSTDSGVNWIERESNRDWSGVASSADGTSLAAVDYADGFLGGRIYTSEDSGVTWVAEESDRGWTDVASSADGTRLVAVDAGVGEGEGGEGEGEGGGGRIYTSGPPAAPTVAIASGAQGTQATVQYLGNGQWATVSPVAPGGLFSPQLIEGTSRDAVPNTSYLATDAALTTVELPGGGQLGDVIKITGEGAGGWSATQFSADPSIWTQRGGNGRTWYGVASSADGAKLVAVDTGSFVFTSTDYGETWIQREDASRNWQGVASSADGTRLIGATGNGGEGSNRIYISSDSGLTWTAQGPAANWRCVTSSADGTMLVAGAIGDSLYTSTDFGLTWTARDSARNWWAVTSSADGTKLVAVTNSGQIYTSTDSGVTWTARESHRNWTGVASSADGTKLVATAATGGADRIYTSTDSGVAWTPRESPREWVAVASSADGTKLVAVVKNGQIYTSGDSGVSWTPQDSNRWWWAVASSADGSRLVAAVYAGGIYTSGTISTFASGAQNTTSTFQKLANGQWGAVSRQLVLADILAPPLKPVVAWGDNDDGQTFVPPLANVAAVAAGSTQSLVLVDDGTVVAWGSGPAVPAGLNNVTHIAAGTSHFLARKSDGTVQAWGTDTYGQATVPAGITTATKVAAGEKHSLVLLDDGTVTACGDNSFDQTSIPGGLTNVTAIAAGYDHSLALKADKTVVAWGRNDSGQRTVPVGLSNVVAIAAGAYHSLALKDDGSVVGWGWDAGGQSVVKATILSIIDTTKYELSQNLPAATNDLLYDETTPISSTSDGTTIVTVADTATLVVGMTVSGPGIAITDATRLAGGYAFSMALKTDGTVVAWGNNTDGQTTIPAEATEVTAIAAGASHGLALRADLIPAQVARLDQNNVFTGRVGIKRVAAKNTLEVEGQASKSTAGSWLSNSDRRIKTEVQPVTKAVETLDRIRLVDFRYTEDYLAAHPGIEDKRYLNVIAQEFAKVFPEHVQRSGETLPDGSEILQVDTYPLTIYAAAAVQELHRENESLKAKLAEQDERLRKLEEALRK